MFVVLAKILRKFFHISLMKFVDKVELNSSFAGYKKIQEKFVDHLEGSNNQELYRVDRAGAHIFKCVSCDELLERNASLLHHLRIACDLSQKIQQDLMMPLIRRTASLCNCLPASEGAHDPDPGGLFRHSLTVALNAVSNVSKTEEYRKRERLILCILWASLSHDLGKILTDFMISSDGGIVFDPLQSSLEEFINQTKSSHIRVQFIEGRGRSHDRCRMLRTLIFTRNDLRLFSYLNDVEESSNLLNGTHIAWELVSMADGLSVTMSSSRGGKYISVPDFIMSWIRRKLLEPNAANTFNADFMLLPPEYGGILLRQGSRSYKSLLCELRYFYGEKGGNNVQSLRSTGSAALAGRGRFFTWYRIEFDDGCCLYVKGVLIRIKTLDDERARFGEVSICERGSSPLEIRTLIKENEHMCSCQRLEDGTFVPIEGYSDLEVETQDLYNYDNNTHAQFRSEPLKTDLSVSDIAKTLEKMQKLQSSK